MWSVFLSLSFSLLASASTYWQFDGPLAFETQRWLQKNYGFTLTDHIFDEETLHEWIVKQAAKSEDQESIPDQALMTCLRGLSISSGPSEPCEIDQQLMKIAHLSGRVLIHASVEGSIFSLKLAMMDQRGQVTVYRSSGETLDQAGRALVEKALGVGQYRVTGIPDDADVMIDEVLVGKGSGVYSVSQGEHTLKITAKDYQPYESKFSLDKGQSVSEELKLVSSYATLKIKIIDRDQLEDLIVKVDEVLFDLSQLNEMIRLKPGEHVIKVDARDRQAVERKFELKPGEEGQWKIDLQLDRAPWKIALKYPHPDTQRGLQQVSFQFQTQTLRAGQWDAGVEGFQDRDKAPDQVRGQSESLNGFGLDIGFNWRAEPSWGLGPLSVSVIGLTYEHFGTSQVADRVKIDDNALKSVSAQYQLTSLSRFKTRFLWVGYQLPMWRLIPYFHTGLIYLYETGELRSEQDDGELSQHSMRWGWEVGVDYKLSPEWTIKASMSGEAWPGQRWGLQTRLGAAYAFDLFSSLLE